MAIEGIAPETTMDRSSSASGSSGGDGLPAVDKKTEPGVVCLDPELMEAPPEYLTLSLTPSSAAAAAKYRRCKRKGEVSLAYVHAPRDYLSLSLRPSDQPKRRRRRDASGASGSGVADASSSAAASGTAEGALVVVGAVLPAPPPAHITGTCLPPKKRNLPTSGVHMETAGTAPPASTVNHQGGMTGPSSPPGDGEMRPSAAMASHPIDAVPLQAVYFHGGVRHHFRLSSVTGETITTNDSASSSSSAVAGSSCQSPYKC